MLFPNNIVLNHPDFAVLNKPAGLHMHTQHGVTEAVIPALRALKPDEHWHLVHRLDAGTSGLLLVAKNKSAAAELSQAFAERTIRKWYIALSDHKPSKKQGWVVGDMKPARRGCWRLLKRHDNPAVSQFFSASIRPGLRLFLWHPQTGKTHQLRVAMKSIGSPILGDERYGGTGHERLHLHAFALQWRYQGQSFQLSQPPPPQGAFAEVGGLLHNHAFATPWQLNWPMRK